MNALEKMTVETCVVEMLTLNIFCLMNILYMSLYVHKAQGNVWRVTLSKLPIELCDMQNRGRLKFPFWLPTCGQWCRAKVSTTEKGITHYYYFTICTV